MKRHLLTAALLLAIALPLSLAHYTFIDRVYLDARMELHAQIINGSAESPYRYRVLVPFVAEGLIRILKGPVGWPAWRAFLYAYGLVDAGLIAMLLGSLFLYLRRWLSWGFSMAGILGVAAVFPMTLFEQYFQPWSYLETALLALTLVAAQSRRKELWAAICILLASLNRESGIFAVLAFFLATFDFERLFSGLRQRTLRIDWKALLTTLGLGLIWLAVFLGLRAWRGNTPQIHSLMELWQYNTRPDALLKTGVHWLAFIGPVAILAVCGMRAAPGVFRRLVWLLPFYLVTILAWGIWSEVRLLLPLYVVLLPPALFFIAAQMDKKRAAC